MYTGVSEWSSRRAKHDADINKESYCSEFLWKNRILQEFPWLLNLADVQHIVKMSNPVEFQRAYGQDSVGYMLREADVNSILGFKQRLVNQLEGPNIVPFDKIVTRGYGGYGGGMYGR